MRILLVDRDFPADGPELARRGHEVAALYVSERDDAADGLRTGERDGVRTFEAPPAREPRDVSETWLRPSERAAFERVLDAEGPEAVHFHHLGPWGAGCLGSARAAGSGVLLSAHDLHVVCEEGHFRLPDGRPCPAAEDEACFECLRRHPLVASHDGWNLEGAAELRRRFHRELLQHARHVLCPTEDVSQVLTRSGLVLPEQVVLLSPDDPEASDRLEALYQDLAS